MSTTSCTITTVPQPQPHAHLHIDSPKSPNRSLRSVVRGDDIPLQTLGGSNNEAAPRESAERGGDNGEEMTGVVAGSNVARVQQRWNQPKGNVWRLGAVFLAMMNIGANDASYGV